MVSRTLVIAQSVILFSGAQALGAAPIACTGSVPLGTFRVSIRRAKDAAALPVKEISSIPTGSTLVWDPVHVSPPVAGKAEVAALVVQQSSSALSVLNPKKVSLHQEWQLPGNPGVIALVLGPDGLSMGKVKALLARDSDLLQQLADYADQTSQVEALVQDLANAEEAGVTADAALEGFSARYGVALPRLNTKSGANQQASTLLTALMPSAKAYDPLATDQAQVQQSAGLAASVAGLFFGNGVGLAAGGAVLFTNLKASLFPATEFRSTFAQNSAAGSMAFCTKTSPAKSRTRLAFLWAYRFPNVKVPAVAVAEPLTVPLDAKSTIKLKAGDGENVKDLSRAREWKLVPVSGGAGVAVPVPSFAFDSLTLDLSRASLAAGSYRLAATWDWDPLSLGRIDLHPYSDFSHARLAAHFQDNLLEGHGVVTVQLTGADFEFVEKAGWQKVTARPETPKPVFFVLPRGPRQGEQESMEVDLDTAAAGQFHLLLAQSDGVTHSVPVTVLPPNPKISNLPLRIHVGEAQEAVRLEGAGLERVEGLETDAGAVNGAAHADEWSGRIQIKSGIKAGEHFNLALKIKGLDNPMILKNAVEAVGPRPVISAVRTSVPGNLGIEIHEKELPAGTVVGLVLQVDHLHDGAARPRLELNCRTGDLRQALSLTPDEPAAGASVSFAGAGALYLSLDPGVVGFPGCEMTAAVRLDPEGPSHPMPIGRVVRLPRLDEFTLTTEALSPNTYTGILKGRDLDVVARAGWDAEHSLPVAAIPTPAPGAGPGQAGEQTLRIAVPWPAPSPHAPLYIWLPGETIGRKTNVCE